MSSKRVQVNIFECSNWVRCPQFFYTVSKIKASSEICQLENSEVWLIFTVMAWFPFTITGEERSYLLSFPGLKLNAPPSTWWSDTLTAVDLLFSDLSSHGKTGDTRAADTSSTYQCLSNLCSVVFLSMLYAPTKTFHGFILNDILK